jgi:hypothetical protein
MLVCLLYYFVFWWARETCTLCVRCRWSSLRASILRHDKLGWLCTTQTRAKSAMNFMQGHRDDPCTWLYIAGNSCEDRTGRTFMNFLSKISKLFLFYFHSCTVHLDTIDSFIYPTDAQPECPKMLKFTLKLYMRVAPTCFGFLQLSSGSCYMRFAKVIVNTYNLSKAHIVATWW